MTAEIAVMNRHGVALAADSAVTVSFGRGQKIYNSVNKLFTLSKYAPVGVMVYGVADLTGVPWETIIKAFRHELGDKRFSTLAEYAEALTNFINGHKVMFGPSLQQGQLLSSVLVQFRSVLADVDRAMDAEIAAKGALDDKRVRAIANTAIRRALEEWSNADRLVGVPAKHAERLRRTYAAEIDFVMGHVFGNLPLGPTAKERLREIAGLVFTAKRFPDSVSGVVVAGFGEDEFFPSVVAFDMEGVLLNFVKVQQNEGKSAAISNDGSSAIVPFAQGEMVGLFMEGLDPGFRVEISNALEAFVGELPDALVTSLAIPAADEPAFRQRVAKTSDELAERFIAHIQNHARERHIDPVVDAVAHLPKEELAAMADSLVSLTSFKRRVTQDPETVGGPIDVAVISKGDGFIWIRRKHYFDPALNHQFFANYNRK